MWRTCDVHINLFVCNKVQFIFATYDKSDASVTFTTIYLGTIKFCLFLHLTKTNPTIRWSISLERMSLRPRVVGFSRQRRRRSWTNFYNFLMKRRERKVSFHIQKKKKTKTSLHFSKGFFSYDCDLSKAFFILNVWLGFLRPNLRAKKIFLENFWKKSS